MIYDTIQATSFQFCKISCKFCKPAWDRILEAFTSNFVLTGSSAEYSLIY